MRFLVDAQLPPALARFIASYNHVATHVYDHVPEDASDTVVIELAEELGAVIVTKDDDFVVRSDQNGRPPHVVWVRLGNCRNATLLSAFENALPVVVSAIENGQRVIEVAS